MKGPRVPFSRLLPAVAHATGVSVDQLVRVGRQREWVEPRALLVYTAREWSGMTVKLLGRRLHRDASMISRLYAGYATRRNGTLERRVRSLLTQ